MAGKKIPAEALIDLRRQLDSLTPRSCERKLLVEKTAMLYGVSQSTLYRYLKKHTKSKITQRSDRGEPRVISKEEMEYYCELIAAIKVRTSNKKGRHLSTQQAIYLLENQGIYTPDRGIVKLPKSLLKKSTVNFYLKKWGYNYKTLFRQPPATRFQASHSNQCWHFDLSPSDLKHIKNPSRVREDQKRPTLMLYSVVDDRSGVAYFEYHCTYGEDVETALRFLFNAMSEKNEHSSFQGIPEMIYMDNGPIRRSHIFTQVMDYLQVDVKSHMPEGKDGSRKTARAKGKVERPFRTVKEMLEALYHLREPETEDEANSHLSQFLVRYNAMQHRNESHSRMEDWFQNIPKSGVKKMCSWERFCAFAREKEERKVASDARISVDGIYYEVDPNLAGEKVTLWWGIFDNELFVEFDDKKYGPYSPIGAPIPLHEYRKFKQTECEKRFCRIEDLAEKLELPNSNNEEDTFVPSGKILFHNFVDPDPFQEISFPSSIAAKKEISNYLGIPLAKLTSQQLEEIDQVLVGTLVKKDVMEQIRCLFPLNKGRYNVQ